MNVSSRKLPVKKTGSPLLNALTGKLPLKPVQTVNMAIKPYIALDCFVRTQGNSFLYGTLVQNAVVVELLCLKGYQPEAVGAVREAQQHLVPLFNRGSRTGEWGVESSEYEALVKLLAIYSAQLERVNATDLMQAHSGMMDMLMARIAQCDEPVAA